MFNAENKKFFVLASYNFDFLLTYNFVHTISIHRSTCITLVISVISECFYVILLQRTALSAFNTKLEQLYIYHIY